MKPLSLGSSLYSTEPTDFVSKAYWVVAGLGPTFETDEEAALTRAQISVDLKKRIDGQGFPGIRDVVRLRSASVFEVSMLRIPRRFSDFVFGRKPPFGIGRIAPRIGLAFEAAAGGELPFGFRR